MIFVTVGTHEQPFNRLLNCIDKIAKKEIIKEKIIVQKGYTNIEMKYCESYNFLKYEDMQKYIKKARIIITHGGPSSFIAPLSIGKIPIVVPRKKEFNEHINNHQLEFAKQVEKRMNNIIVAETDEQIEEAIVNYNEKIKNLQRNITSNNKQFIIGLEKEIDKIL